MEHHTRVLVADGSEAFTESLAALLRERGYAVTGTASDGDRALELLRQSLPDVLILDLMLPRRDGLSILKELPKENRPRIILLSVFTTDYIASCSSRSVRRTSWIGWRRFWKPRGTRPPPPVRILRRWSRT